MAKKPTVSKSGLEPEPERSPLKVLVAVDFGTTFSSVAYRLVDDLTGTLVTEWDEGLTGEKVPTVLRYENGGTSGVAYWGFEAVNKRKNGEKIHEWFKLGLCPELEETRAIGSELLRKYPSKIALPPVKQEECEELVISYLLRLKRAVNKHIETHYPELKDLPREHVITVPAMWSHGAQEAMRKCAAEAFLDNADLKENLRMLAEPEAAGIYALSKMREITLEKGDTFVICDAGGGTVDLSSYKITSKDDFIGLTRVSTISGELCGSSFLNRIFEDYLTKRPELQHLDWEDDSGLRYLRAAVAEFESTIKPYFTGQEAGPFNLTTMFMGLHGTIVGGGLDISATDLREKVFDKVISKICNLVRDQVGNTSKTTGSVKEILLAGGFGQNAYLKRRVEQEVGKGIKVRKIEDSPTAIVRGALMARLPKPSDIPRREKPKEGDEKTNSTNDPPVRQGMIFARKPAYVTGREAPRHYGVRLFREEKISTPIVKNGRIRRINETRYVEFMEWFVNKVNLLRCLHTQALEYPQCSDPQSELISPKGDEILDGDPKRFELRYKADIAPGEVRPKIHCDVYSSKADEPPSLPDTKEHPEPSLEKPLATLTIDLSKVESLPYEVKNGRHFYNVPFDVYMTLNSAELTFELGRGDERYKPAKVTVNESEWLSR
ncbi:Hsp70 family chaperone [Purpureocillium lavendulum]|uniref:Hsp70 family chaperone n=1 Tax=Purpureocillium lavendulum TaxID=1247861 RepID=A0AB34FUB7_9HYPO|nr:Hsp70 family chaperone [Purpureocillium lavendulum]